MFYYRKCLNTMSTTVIQSIIVLLMDVLTVNKNNPLKLQQGHQSLCILLWEPLLSRLLGSCIYFEGKYHWISGVTPASFTPFQCLMMLRGTGVPHSLSLYIHNSGSPRKDKLTGHGRWKHMCDVETLDASVHCTYRGILWLLNDWRFGRLLLFLLLLASKPASHSFIYL